MLITAVTQLFSLQWLIYIHYLSYLRVVQGGLWHDSQTEKTITDIKFSFSQITINKPETPFYNLFLNQNECLKKAKS